jgi:prolyl-tRNA synthetase
MRVSHLFTKTSKNAPADEVAKNAQLLIRAGYIHKEMAGVYTYLPLGKKVLENIIQVIREEMDAVGGNEMALTALQASDVWKASGRWDDDVMDVWFKTKLANGTELGLAPTHEEPLTQLMKGFVHSYKDLPVYPYQFQTKFRNEIRSKSGLMRGREFWMKDLYSFSRTQEEHDAFYEKISEAYHTVFARLGLGELTYKTFASGGSFAKFSHEFQTLSPVGEDTIYVHKEKQLAINKEVFNDEVLAELGIARDELVEEKAVEVGNIFTLGTRFSEPLELRFTDENGDSQLVIMGSYGIGPSRLMGLLAEHFADDKGLVWPEAVAPYRVYLVQIGDDETVTSRADSLYRDLTERGVEVLYDDRDERPGAKFADAELLGIPHRVTVSQRSIDQDGYEYAARSGGESFILTRDELLAKLA